MNAGTLFGIALGLLLANINQVYSANCEFAQSTLDAMAVCKAEVGPPSGDEVLCNAKFATCLYGKTGALGPDGDVLKDKLLADIDAMTGDDKFKAQLRDGLNKCIDDTKDIADVTQRLGKKQMCIIAGKHKICD